MVRKMLTKSSRGRSSWPRCREAWLRHAVNVGRSERTPQELAEKIVNELLTRFEHAYAQVSVVRDIGNAGPELDGDVSTDDGGLTG